MGLSEESLSSGVRTVNVNETWWFVELLGYREGMPYKEASIKRNRISQSLNSRAAINSSTFLKTEPFL
jgi:hypothetical protein